MDNQAHRTPPVVYFLHMARARQHHKNFVQNLEVYAFWTGFTSTLISLVQVVIIALKNGA